MQLILITNKSSGYDLITGRILKEPTKKALLYVTYLYNAILRFGYSPMQGKVAEIILTLRPRISPTEQKFFKPINLLTTTNIGQKKNML